jgi:hypothetical protein
MKQLDRIYQELADALPYDGSRRQLEIIEVLRQVRWRRDGTPAFLMPCADLERRLSRVLRRVVSLA